jgi:hypothetical protein
MVRQNNNSELTSPSMTTKVEQKTPQTTGLEYPYALASEQILTSLEASKLGLTQDEAAVRLQRYGRAGGSGFCILGDR